jgi:hypothetical protein
MGIFDVTKIAKTDDPAMEIQIAIDLLVECEIALCSAKASRDIARERVKGLLDRLRRDGS